MSSETEHDIAKQPEPTCPMIDALQKKLRDAESAMSRFERCDDPEQLRDMLDSVRRELFHWDTAEDSLEAIRKHVESIRAWGEEWKQYALKLATTDSDESHDMRLSRYKAMAQGMKRIVGSWFFLGKHWLVSDRSLKMRLTPLLTTMMRTMTNSNSHNSRRCRAENAARWTQRHGAAEERKMNEYQQEEYRQFISFYEKGGLEFPCTAQQFWARAVEYSDGDPEMVDLLCQQGIGPNWRQDD